MINFRYQLKIARRTSWILFLLVAISIWFALPASYRVWVEPAAHAATFSVTNTNDDGPGSLRNAIVVSNLNMGPSANVINFNIPGSEVQTINLASVLPTITAPVTIDGTTQPGFSGTPIIELRGQQTSMPDFSQGAAVRPNAGGALLEISAGNCTVRGLRINRFGGAAILLHTNGNNVIQGNYIGNDGPMAVAISIGSSNNTIGGTTGAARNVISNCNFSAVMIDGSSNVVQGNFIGTDATGTLARGNASGLAIHGSNNVIGGTTAGAGNVISGNHGDGVVVYSGGNVVQRNRIGTDVTGNANLGNSLDGISISGGDNNLIQYNLISGNDVGVTLDGGSQGTTLLGNLIGVNVNATLPLRNIIGIRVISSHNVIGPAVNVSSDMNIIAGNTFDGIDISGALNLVRGNLIGNNGVIAIPNGGDGIFISRSDNTIGGTSYSTANVISGNGANGIEISGLSGVLNHILGNCIGVDGTTFLRPLPNGASGILLHNTASGNTIGGPNTVSSLPQNFIAYNKGAGVLVAGGDNNKIVGNYIHDNVGAGVFLGGEEAFAGPTSVLGNRIFNDGGLAIDLAPAGVTPNDPGDVDGGPNGGQNFPLLSYAAAAQGKALIKGTLNSRPNATYRLEFFRNDSCDPSGNGEAEGFLGFASTTTDGKGNASFEFSSGNGTDGARAGQVVSATATDSIGNTSELSPCLAVQDAGTFSLLNSSTTVSEAAGSVTLTVGRSGNRIGSASVDYSTRNGLATAGNDYLAVSGTLTFAEGETQKSISVPIINDSLAEGIEDFQVRISNPQGGPGLGLSNANVIIDDDEQPSRMLYVITTENELLTFNTAQGGPAPQSSVSISGEKILAIDFRPATGQLYGLGVSGHLFVIDKNTGALTQVGTSAISGIAEQPDCGFDFNPVTDRLRLALWDGRNLQLNPDTGALFSTDGALNFVSGNPDPGARPSIYGLANSNNFAGATSTTTYALNKTQGVLLVHLVTLGSLNGSPVSPNTGQLFTIGYTNRGTSDYAGFDITDENEAFASLSHPDDFEPTGLFKVDLTTGAATRIGTLGSVGGTPRDIAVEPRQRVQFSAALYSSNESAGSATITVKRNGGASGPLSVNYATSDGTATAGLDYTATSGTLNFADGETSKTFSVPLIDDSLIEGVESIHLTISNATNGAVVGPLSTASIAIMDESTEAGTNAIDNADFFVRQHYADFLNRQPDDSGLVFWTNHVTQCFSDAACIHERRVGTSAAFFIENEFQQTGFFVYRLYRAAFARRPSFAEFVADRSTIVGGPNLEANKTALVADFVQRAGFKQAYPDSLSNEQYVNQLFDTAGLTPFTTERQGEIAAMGNGRTRAQVLRNVIELEQFRAREFNPGFVLAQYFGYLRRDPDQDGYDFWLNHLNNRSPNNYRAMVCAFITSVEYQHRFGQIVTRHNSDCSP